MDDDSKIIQLPEVLPLSTPQLPSTRENLNRLKAARQLVGKVLSSYPDYDKASPPYVSGIIEVFACYPETIQERLSHIIDGLRGRHAYLPTIADVVKMANEFEATALVLEVTQVAVVKWTPAWKAWEKFKGRKLPSTQIRIDGKLMEGWLFPSEYPPSAT